MHSRGDCWEKTIPRIPNNSRMSWKGRGRYENDLNTMYPSMKFSKN